MPTKIVAIHQPNFFPWLGFFDKLARSDVFILMDEVQFPRSGAGSWVNRVQVLVDGRARWMTMPIDRSRHEGTWLICETLSSEAEPWRRRMTDTLRQSYARAPFFGASMTFLRPFVEQPMSHVSEYNETAIRGIAAALDMVSPEIVRMSSLSYSGRATDLLISLVRAVGGDTYLCGAGSAGYLEPEKFAANGVELTYQDFRHPVYPQLRTASFVPGLSIIDALMSCGIEGTRELMRVRSRM